MLHLLKEAGPCRAPVRGWSPPLSPASVDPPRCVLRGGARPSQVLAGRGVSVTLFAFPISSRLGEVLRSFWVLQLNNSRNQ